MSRPYCFTSLPFIVIAALAFSVTSAAGSDSSWSYCSPPSPTCTNGPEQWGGLCQSGSSQSPINIVPPTPTKLPQIQFSYELTKGLEAINNGHTIEVGYGKGSSHNSIKYETNGKVTTYKLINFHFHEHSEHKINGTYSSMEVHLVHQAENGALLVVAVLLSEGTANKTVTEVWAKMLPASGSYPRTAKVDVNAERLLPGTKDFNQLQYYTYQGSLTTPTGPPPAHPTCTEGVTWLVLVKQNTVSQDQIDAFGKPYPNNFRPPQKQRKVQMSGGK